MFETRIQGLVVLSCGCAVHCKQVSQAIFASQWFPSIGSCPVGALIWLRLPVVRSLIGSGGGRDPVERHSIHPGRISRQALLAAEPRIACRPNPVLRIFGGNHGSRCSDDSAAVPVAELPFVCI